MSQSFTDNVFDPTHVVQTDMSNVELNFAALKSSFSGTGTPSNLVSGMFWFDTTNTILRVRDAANTGWLGIMNGDTNTKMWIYANLAADGWVVDSTVTDTILAIKGGTDAYNISGGGAGGTWTWPTHTLTSADIPAHSHNIDSDAHDHDFYRYSAGGGSYQSVTFSTDGDRNTASVDSDSHSHNCDNYGSGGAHSHGAATYRPAASVGTLQYLNL